MKEFDFHLTEPLVRGTVVSTFICAFGPYKSRGVRILNRILEVDGIGTSEDDLYPVKKYLEANEELQNQFGRDFMQRVGAAIFDKAIFPPGIDSLVSAMESIDVAYNMNHVHAEGVIGAYKWEQTGDRSGVMVVDIPYPCSVDLGIIISIASRFEDAAQVVHDDDAGCRHFGADSCTYKVSW